jgi:hypothetical protein
MFNFVKKAFRCFSEVILLPPVLGIGPESGFEISRPVAAYHTFKTARWF